MKNIIESLEKEEKEINKRLRGEMVKETKKESLMGQLLAKFEAFNEYIKNYKPPEVNVEFPKNMEVKGEVSILNKIKALIDFPEVQKVEGEVKVKNQVVIPEVKFPEVQKVEGKVKAEVKFPEVQKVSIGFDSIIEVLKKIKIPIGRGTKAEVGKADPTVYVPVRLSDGQKFYNAIGGVGGSLSGIKGILDQIFSATQANSTVTATTSESYDSRLIDETSTTNVTYIGYCSVGSIGSTTSAVWNIKKIDESVDPVSIGWAGGVTDFSNKWSLRTSYTYS